jgi:hypothetical protein
LTVKKGRGDAASLLATATDAYHARPDPSDHALRHFAGLRYRVPVFTARPDAHRGRPGIRFERNDQHVVHFHRLRLSERVQPHRRLVSLSRADTRGGLNVGISAGGVLGWAVFAPTIGISAGALAGDYVGVSGDIGLGVGAGANVLVGGSGRTFALQPLSLQGSVALNVALGVSALTLRWH